MNPLLLQAAMPFLPPLQLDPLLPFDPADFERHGPRGYQLDLLWQIVEAIEAGHRRILLQLPTGGGKTKIATALLASADRAQFVVHRKELIEQTSRAFWGAGVPHSFVASGKPFDSDAEVLIAGIATLAIRLSAVPIPDIVIVDEAHHTLAKSWRDVVDEYPDALIIGLTATPQRLDGRGMDDFYEHLILGPSVRWLIDRGYLSEFDYYGPPPATEDDASLLGDVVDHYQQLAPGQPGIVFASNRQHGRALTAEFEHRNISAAYVDGTMNTGERERADAMFRSGAIKVLVNVGLFGEGYDVPNVVYCGIARRTQSLSWFLQMVGRALRTAPGKDRAIICDHGNNWFLHGMPDDDRKWSLAGKLRGSGAGCNDDATPIHQCLTCYMITPSKMSICPGCGTGFPTVTRNIRFKEGTLTKIERDETRVQKEEARMLAVELRKAEERACTSEREFVELGRRRGYPHPEGWARRKIGMRGAWRGRR